MPRNEEKQEKPQKDRGRYAFTAKELCYSAVSVALLCVCSWIAVPLGSIPVTLQTLALFVLIGLFNGRRAGIAVLAWLVLGAFGAPVFSGFTGGITALLSPTGGFLIGFLFATPLAGFLYRGGFKKRVFALSICLLVYNACAVVWFCIFYTGFFSGGLLVALTTCVLPYLPFDIVKMTIAVPLTQKLKERIRI